RPRDRNQPRSALPASHTRRAPAPALIVARVVVSLGRCRDHALGVPLRPAAVALTLDPGFAGPVCDGHGSPVLVAVAPQPRCNVAGTSAIVAARLRGGARHEHRDERERQASRRRPRHHLPFLPPFPPFLPCDSLIRSSGDFFCSGGLFSIALLAAMSISIFD